MDTGIGIHPLDLDRIFEPFERATHGPQMRTPGTGLGLTITRRLTETMGGEIGVRSEVGKGSAFQVKLMLAEVTRPRHGVPLERRVRGYAGPRQTIMVVDDDFVHRDLVRELLEPLGFHVVAAANGAACLALVNDSRPNLILLDISMPEMDGWTVARQLKNIARERPAIVMLSAIATEDRRALDPERLYDDFLMKPIDLRQMLEKFHDLLDIEWLTHSEPETPAADRKPAGKPLERKDIDRLIALSQIGHFQGLNTILDEIEATSSASASIVAELRGIVNSFNFPRLVKVLETQGDGHAAS